MCTSLVGVGISIGICGGARPDAAFPPRAHRVGVGCGATPLFF